MNAGAMLIDRLAATVILGEPDAAVALATLRASGLPASTDEHWQFTNLRALQAVQLLAPATPAPAAAVAALLPAPVPGFERLLVCDGVPPAVLPPGVTASNAAALRRNPDPDLRLATVTELRGLPPLQLQLGGTQQLELVFAYSGAAGAVYPRLQLELLPAARVTLLERHVGTLAAGSWACTDLAFELATGSELTHYRLQALGSGALLFDQLAVRLAAQSRYTAHQIAVNAGSSRTTAVIELAGADSRCQWQSVAHTGTGENHDLLLRVTHAAPRTNSLSCFRGIATGQSRASCSMDVQVGALARGAEVSQSLKGLNDGAGAAVNLRPRLTIETDDIQARHGATTGQLDEQLLFYLRSRGLDADTARRLLKWAFLGEVFATISALPVRRIAEQLAAAHLATALPPDLAA
jgi:Fe-S cluster assembly protein SufD